MRKIRRTGEGTYRGADAARNASLTVESGEVVEVMDETADALLAEGGWEDMSPKPQPSEPRQTARPKPDRGEKPET